MTRSPETLRRLAVVAIVSLDGVPAWQADAIAALRAEPSCDLRVFGDARAAHSYGTIARLLARRQLANRSLEGVVELDDLGVRPPVDVVIDFRHDAEALPQPFTGRYGTWIPEMHSSTRELPYARSVASGDRVVEARLRIANTSRVLRTGRFGIRYSYALTLTDVFRHLSAWPALCVRLAAAGTVASRDVAATMPDPQRLGAWDLLRFGAAQAYRAARAALRFALVDDAWDIGTVSIDAGRITSERVIVSGVRWMHPRERRPFYADPFFLPGASPAVLCETFSHRLRQGNLVAIGVDERWRPLAQTRIAADSGHWSYPFVFRYDGTAFCLPETSDKRRVDAFTFDRGTLVLERHQTVLDGIGACDSTIVNYLGTWWLFCTRAGCDSNAALYLYSAPSPFGPWTPHAANPVKTDLANARPAGPLFVENGVLYRPAQDCSVRYGGAVVINRVLRLDSEAFVEEPAARIDSGDARLPHGIHTFARLPDGRILIDGRREYLTLRKAWGMAMRRRRSAAVAAAAVAALLLCGQFASAAPAHVRTYLYYGAFSTNVDIPGSYMARKATFVETAGGTPELVGAFKAAGGEYALAYTDPTLVPYCKPPFVAPAGACAGPIGKEISSNEDAWLHAPDGARLHRADAYTHEYQDVLNPASAVTQRAYARYTAGLAAAARLDGFFADDTGSEMNGAFDGFGGASRELAGPQAWLAAERGLIASAARPVILNGDGEDWGPAYGGALARSRNVLGVNFEGCFSSAAIGILDQRYGNWPRMENALLADDRLARYVVCMMTGPFAPAQRLYALASWWLSYDSRWSVAAPVARAPDGHTVYPEYDIVPESPIRSAHARIGELADGGAYVREFARCYQDARNIGRCAAVVNDRNVPIPMPSVLRRYSQRLSVDAASEYARGRATWTNGVPATLAPLTGLVLLDSR